MGILRNLFRGKSGSKVVAVESPVPGQSRTQIRMEVSTAVGGEQGLVKLSGTTTFARDAITRLAQRHAIDKGGYLEMQGSLQREPDNPADPKAVAVHVEGEKVGYLPGYVARDLRLSSRGAQSVRVQIFTELLPKGLRAEAWAWLGQESQDGSGRRRNDLRCRPQQRPRRIRPMSTVWSPMRWQEAGSARTSLRLAWSTVSTTCSLWNPSNS